jgi:glycosyltransferase involved in cell wall biosynthesis
MIDGQKVVVIMPAYNAEKTLLKTYEEVPHDLVDEVILTDDFSTDRTVEVARRLDLTLIVHDENRGYGGNQKTCYSAALEAGADIVIMLHPDYQYTPKLISAMSHLIASGEYDVLMGSRILVKGALSGGMPIYKYIANRFLTLVQNLLVRHKLSEYHTGYRAFRRQVLEQLPLAENSDDFLFDNQIMAQTIYFGYRIGEISCPARYEPESSSINFRRSVRYGLGVLWTSCQFVLQRLGLARFPIFDPEGRRLTSEPNQLPKQSP